MTGRQALGHVLKVVEGRVPGKLWTSDFDPLQT